MVKTAFYAMRHGETPWNAQGRFQGHSDIPLSAEGRAQALAGASRLTAKLMQSPELPAPERILTSPLGRARETAEIVRCALGLPDEALHADARLREAGFGAWEGLTTLEVKARFPEERRRRKADRWSYAPPGGESYANIDRAMRGLIDELDRAPLSLLVTHAGNLRIMMMRAAGRDPAEALRDPVGHGVVHFFDGRGMRVV
ncbi:histidine phosphatase family protein [Nitratireductor sp. CAU 1489]|uniref:Histidine phosphatase family protein n=1 Tax=Nitratireductor arenosus TaxID=2682096 RepID=A0A844QHD3_9HYPH|nr:histidine phosphatase family protein [Nitratireductor arenosus]MVA99336.1 histidine phosphatase family protein [Nitratireductor arenosus]